MSEIESLHSDDEFASPEGPRTPDEDEEFGPEPDDPRAAGRFEDPHDVPDFDAALEERDMCSEEATS
ncbi:MAG: hypothetical protein ACR2H2_19800 [Solirubrobacteraceae bacterium]